MNNPGTTPMSEPQDYDETFSRALGNELRRAREEAGRTRAQLATGLPDIDDRVLLSYEQGSPQLTLERLVQLCGELGASAPELLAKALEQAGPEDTPPAQ